MKIFLVGAIDKASTAAERSNSGPSEAFALVETDGGSNQLFERIAEGRQSLASVAVHILRRLEDNESFLVTFCVDHTAFFGPSAYNLWPPPSTEQRRLSSLLERLRDPIMYHPNLGIKQRDLLIRAGIIQVWQLVSLTPTALLKRVNLEDTTEVEALIGAARGLLAPCGVAFEDDEYPAPKP